MGKAPWAAVQTIYAPPAAGMPCINSWHLQHVLKHLHEFSRTGIASQRWVLDGVRDRDGGRVGAKKQVNHSSLNHIACLLVAVEQIADHPIPHLTW